jgi:hypothetical protein
VTALTRPPMGDVSTIVDRPHRRIEGRARPARMVESRTISTLTQALVEAESRALLAEEDLDDAHAELEQRIAELHGARDDCERLHAALPAIQQTAQEAIARSTRLDAQLAEQQRVHGQLATQLAAERERLARCAASLVAERAATEQGLAAERAAAEERLTAERAASDARLAAMHEQAAEAIRRAEALASATLERARDTAGRSQLECEQQIARAADGHAEALAHAEQARVEAQTRAAQAQVEAQTRVEQAQVEADARAQERMREAVDCALDTEAHAELAVRTQLELRLAAEARADALQAEVDALQQALEEASAAPAPAPIVVAKPPAAAGPTETELRLSRDLAAAARENDELLARLQRSERALRSRERELERERKLADEATRWASRAERALVAGPLVRPIAEAKPTAGTPITSSRRRGPRIRVRHGG